MTIINKRIEIASAGRSSGFTLVELFITLAIAGVLASFIIPGFGGLIDSARYNRSSDTLIEALTTARNDAVFNSKQVVVCATDDPNVEYPVCKDNQSDWSTGWILFENCNGGLDRDAKTDLFCDLNDSGSADDPEPLLKTFPPSEFTITNTTGSAVAFFASGIANPETDFEIDVDGEKGEINISSLARIESSKILYQQQP